MGGSYSSGYNGGQIPTSQSNYCGGIYNFTVVVSGNKDQIEEIWNKSNEGDNIKIVLVEGDLPRLEVKRESDDFFIGYVPPTLIKLINCIKNGWKYDGRITHISGNKYQPEIDVEIEGVL